MATTPWRAVQRAKAWGAIDKAVTGLAVQVPWIWDNDVNLRSKNVKAVTNLFNGTWDVAFTSIK